MGLHTGPVSKFAVDFGVVGEKSSLLLERVAAKKSSLGLGWELVRQNQTSGSGGKRRDIEALEYAFSPVTSATRVT